MSDPTASELDGLPDLPFLIHFTSGVTIAVSDGPTGHRTFGYAEELLLTAEILDLNRDRSGRCQLLDRIRRDDGVHRGAWPAHLPRYEPGSLAHADAREAARKAAWEMTDEDQRRAALARVRLDYGDLATSKTLATMPSSR